MSSISWASLYLISEWIIRIGMLLAVPFRRSPEAAKGWLLFGFFLPWPALALYLLIGRPAYPKWRRARFARLAARCGHTRLRTLGVQEDQLPAVADAVGEHPLLGNTPDPPERDELLELVRGAL